MSNKKKVDEENRRCLIVKPQALAQWQLHFEGEKRPMTQANRSLADRIGTEISDNRIGLSQEERCVPTQDRTQQS